MALRHFAVLTRKDVKLVIRNYLFAFAIALALIYILAVRFLIPVDITIDPNFYILDRIEAGLPKGAVDWQHPKIHQVSSHGDLMERVTADNYSVGVVLDGEERVENLEFIFQGFEDPKIKEILVASLQEMLRDAYNVGADRYTVQVLNPGASSEKPPFNLFLVPVFVYSEVIALGLFFAAVMHFAEKGEGTLRAYQVTGRPAWMYLLAKAVALGLVAAFLTVLIVAFTVGWRVDWIALLLVIFLGSVSASLLGVLTANFFHGISDYIFGAVGIILFVSLPMVAYMFPSFSPWWLTWLPTYPMVLAIGEAVFPAGREGLINAALWQLLVANAVLLLAGSRLFQWQLNTQE